MGASFVAHGQAPEAVEPGERPFHHPAVASQSLARLDAFAGDARDDAPLAASQATERIVVAFVRMQLAWPLPGAAALAPHWHDGIQGGLQHLTVVDIGRRKRHRERDPVSVDHHMALAARFAAIRWIRAGGLAPFLAGTAPSPARHATNRVCRPPASGAGSPGAAGPTPPPLASRAGAASRSCHCHSPSLGATVPRGCRSATRTGCPSTPPGH